MLMNGEALPPKAHVRTITRRNVLVGAGVAALMSAAPRAQAADLSGEVVLLNWNGGNDFDAIKELQAAFVAANPGVTFTNVTVTGTGDMRGAIRTALMGGQAADLLINAWPAFRAE